MARLALLAFPFLLTACAAELSGPCLHTYEDPVLTVHSVMDALSGEAIPQIRIRDVRVNGVRTHPEALTRWAAVNVSVDDASLLCDQPCGFGYRDGVYTFSARAPAYEWSSFRAVARYDTFIAGCPSTETGGDSVTVSLTPR